MKKAVIGVGTGLAVLGLFLTPASATESNDDRAHYSDQQVSEMKPDAALTTSIESLEGLALPLPSEELMDWATETQDSLQEIENFGGVRLADDRQSADIYWHGKPDSRVEKAIDASAYPINLKDTAFMPGELRTVAEELLTEGTQVPGVQINATYANPDSSGVTAEVTFTNRNITSEKAESDFEQLSVVDGVHITIKESQEYTPAQGRLDNDVHIGGARIYKDLTMNVCSNAFTTTRGGTSDVRGSLPGGLDQNYIDSLAASDALSLENLQSDEAFLDNDDHDTDASSTSIQPASTCSTATGVPGAGWGGVQSPTYVMSGDPTRRMGYTHQIAPGTNQSGIVRGLGHARDSNGNYGRIWSNFGATGSTPRTDSVVWGAVAAYPHLQAQTTSIHLAQVRWCH